MIKFGECSFECSFFFFLSTLWKRVTFYVDNVFFNTKNLECGGLSNSLCMHVTVIYLEDRGSSISSWIVCGCVGVGVWFPLQVSCLCYKKLYEMAMIHYKSFSKRDFNENEASFLFIFFFLSKEVSFIIETIYSFKVVFLDIYSVGDKVIISLIMRCLLIMHNPPCSSAGLPPRPRRLQEGHAPT